MSTRKPYALIRPTLVGNKKNHFASILRFMVSYIQTKLAQVLKLWVRWLKKKRRRKEKQERSFFSSEPNAKTLILWSIRAISLACWSHGTLEMGFVCCHAFCILSGTLQLEVALEHICMIQAIEQLKKQIASRAVPTHQPTVTLMITVTPKSSKLNESTSNFHLKCHHSSNSTLKLNVAYTVWKEM